MPGRCLSLMAQYPGVRPTLPQTSVSAGHGFVVMGRLCHCLLFYIHSDCTDCGAVAEFGCLPEAVVALAIVCHAAVVHERVQVSRLSCGCQHNAPSLRPVDYNNNM